MYLEYALFYLLGIVVGYLIFRLWQHIKSAYGVLRIDDKTDPDKKIYRFEIDDLNVLDYKDHVMLDIKRDSRK